MISPKWPPNERQRRKEVEKYGLLDSLPEQSYDQITELMAYICDVPISLVTLLDKDRNFLKSHHGVPFNESPRNISFCGHTILSDEEIVVVEDATKDERFSDNPLVTDYKAIFYAGVSLINSNGYKLGTLCVYDHKPRSLNPDQQKALINMAKQVVIIMEKHYENKLLEQARDEMKIRNTDLERFAQIISHDLRSPLNNIVGLIDLIESADSSVLSDDTLEHLGLLKQSSVVMTSYIRGLLDYYKSENTLEDQISDIELYHFIKDVRSVVQNDRNSTIALKTELTVIRTIKAALQQILINLIVNALKYNSKPNQVVEIVISENVSYYQFSVEDNGDGIPSHLHKRIFELFKTGDQPDRDGHQGTGIGLATVKKLVNRMDGQIEVQSKVGLGSQFKFSIAKDLVIVK
ncbi:MAG: GAF domain-containing sensor histidine kinase [Cyclobacteriaceae bacterium]